MTEYAKLVVSVDSTQVSKARTELEKMPASAGKAESAVSRMGSTFARVGGILATAISVREIARASEQYVNMTNRLRLVTEGSEQLAYAQEAVMRAAQQTYQPLETTAEVYQRIAQNANALGLSFAEVEAVTKTVSRTIALSGADTQAAAGAMRQFGQALASGSLRGDELNSILEGTPALAQAVARGLGVTTGELRAMGAAGELSALKIITALQSQEAEVEEMSRTMNVTAGQAMVTFGNSLVGIVGKLDDASGASRGFASAVLDLSGALTRFSSGEFMDFFRDSKQTAEGFNNEISVTLSKIRDLQDVRRRLDDNDPSDTAFFKFKLYNREEIDAELAELNGQVDRFRKSRDRLIELANKPGEDTPKDESGGNLGGNGPNEESLRDAEKAAARLAALSKSTGESLSRELALYGQSSEAARTHYEIVSGSLKGIAGQEADRLMDLARELDTKRDLTEQEKLRIDILRESGQLRAANDAQFELEYAEKIAEYERQGNVEALKRLETLRRIREIQMNADQAPGTVEGVSQAPVVGAVDVSIAGPFGEMAKLNEQAAAIEQWRATELEKQRGFLEAREDFEAEYAKRVENIHQQHQDRIAQYESARYAVGMAAGADFFGTMATMVGQFAGEQSSSYKALFAMQKAFAVASIIMNAQIAAAKAPAEMTIFAGIPMGAAILAMGYANAAMVGGMALAGMAHDGIDSVPKEGTWLLDKGERVVDRRTNADLKEYLAGKGGGGGGTAPQITIQAPVTIEAQSGASAEEARQFGREAAGAMTATAMSVLEKESRPGGLLWNLYGGGR